MYITYDRYRGYIVRNNFNHNEVAIFLTREEALMFIQRSSLQQNRQSWQNFNGNQNLMNNNQWQQPQQQLPYNNPNSWNNQYPQQYEFNQQYYGPIPPNQYPQPPQFGQNNNRINYNNSYGFNPQQHNNNFQQDIYNQDYNNSYGFNPQIPYSNPYPQYDMNFNGNSTNHPNDYAHPSFIANQPSPNSPTFLDQKSNGHFNNESIPNSHFVELDNKPYVSQTEETVAFKKPPTLDEEVEYEKPAKSSKKKVEESKKESNEEIKKDDENNDSSIKNKEKHLERIDSMIIDEKLIDDNLHNKKTVQVTSNFPNEEIMSGDNTQAMDFIHGDISTKTDENKKIKKWVWITILTVSIVTLIIIIFLSLYLTNTFKLWDKINGTQVIAINVIGKMNH